MVSVRGKRTPEEFLKGLLQPAVGQPHNTADPRYVDKFMVIRMAEYMNACGIEQ
jgi:hypothetical protein